MLVGGVLAAYGIGLLGQATVKLFASGFYALRDTRTPVTIAASSLIVSAILSWLLMRRFGPAGIALGSSIGGTLNTVLHLRDLDPRIGTVLQRPDWRALGMVVAAAILAAGPALSGAFLRRRSLPLPPRASRAGVFLGGFPGAPLARPP